MRGRGSGVRIRLRRRARAWQIDARGSLRTARVWRARIRNVSGVADWRQTARGARRIGRAARRSYVRARVGADRGALAGARARAVRWRARSGFTRKRICARIRRIRSHVWRARRRTFRTSGALADTRLAEASDRIAFGSAGARADARVQNDRWRQISVGKERLPDLARAASGADLARARDLAQGVTARRAGKHVGSRASDIPISRASARLADRWMRIRRTDGSFAYRIRIWLSDFARHVSDRIWIFGSVITRARAVRRARAHHARVSRASLGRAGIRANAGRRARAGARARTARTARAPVMEMRAGAHGTGARARARAWRRASDLLPKRIYRAVTDHVCVRLRRDRITFRLQIRTSGWRRQGSVTSRRITRPSPHTERFSSDPHVTSSVPWRRSTGFTGYAPPHAHRSEFRGSTSRRRSGGRTPIPWRRTQTVGGAHVTDLAFVWRGPDFTDHVVDVQTQRRDVPKPSRISGGSGSPVPISTSRHVTSPDTSDRIRYGGLRCAARTDHAIQTVRTVGVTVRVDIVGVGVTDVRDTRVTSRRRTFRISPIRIGIVAHRPIAVRRIVRHAGYHRIPTDTSDHPRTGGYRSEEAPASDVAVVTGFVQGKDSGARLAIQAWRTYVQITSSDTSFRTHRMPRHVARFTHVDVTSAVTSPIVRPNAPIRHVQSARTYRTSRSFVRTRSAIRIRDRNVRSRRV